MKDNIRSKFNMYRIARNLSSVVRAVIIIGICYVILHPLIVKICVSFMSESDLYDASVKYISKAPNLTNYKMAIDGMEYWKMLIKTGIFSATISLLQLFSCLLTAYGFA
ncbi:MAG: hypothetical protein J6Y09_09405, partial [Lachnospiraceae bacterium]|nr:hypothetical protein [Lachnospiraceae bacterium]